MIKNYELLHKKADLNIILQWKIRSSYYWMSELVLIKLCLLDDTAVSLQQEMWVLQDTILKWLIIQSHKLRDLKIRFKPWIRPRRAMFRGKLRDAALIHLNNVYICRVLVPFSVQHNYCINEVEGDKRPREIFHSKCHFLLSKVHNVPTKQILHSMHQGPGQAPKVSERKTRERWCFPLPGSNLSCQVRIRSETGALRRTKMPSKKWSASFHLCMIWLPGFLWISVSSISL